MQADGAELSKVGVNEGRGGAGIAHCNGLRRSVLELQRDGEDELLLGIGGRIGRSIGRNPVDLCGVAGTVTAARVRRIAQRWTLYYI